MGTSDNNKELEANAEELVVTDKGITHADMAKYIMTRRTVQINSHNLY